MLFKLCRQNGIKFVASLDLPEQLPFQEMDIMSIFSELLDIVIKACIEDTGKHFYVNLDSKEDNNCLIIEVSTNGENIKMFDDKKRKLEKMYTDESQYLSEAIIKEITERIKGDMTISHADGQTTITLRLPIKYN